MSDPQKPAFSRPYKNGGLSIDNTHKTLSEQFPQKCQNVGFATVWINVVELQQFTNQVCDGNGSVQALPDNSRNLIKHEIRPGIEAHHREFIAYGTHDKIIRPLHYKTSVKQNHGRYRHFDVFNRRLGTELYNAIFRSFKQHPATISNEQESGRGGETKATLSPKQLERPEQVTFGARRLVAGGNAAGPTRVLRRTLLGAWIVEPILNETAPDVLPSTHLIFCSSRAST